jgi:serine/threonine-protein kinase
MSPQESIAHYRITSKLGAGGMGEVWRATDTKLGRDVAIKILPEAFAQDADRMARFEREAQVLASLNHPNIAAIYGVEERALIMELVEGETLQGPLPVETALDYAKQIAEALEYAHDRGVIHRDLKPANVKVTPEGRVKVLDFGLAKAVSGESVVADPASSPTLTMRATAVGVIMGTAAYMSPEQAAGKPVDKRADIWSYGVVLWEMLTGKRLFDAETVSHTLADVLRAEIDFGKLPAGTPPAVRELLRRCLDRNVKTRLRDIGEARVALDKPGEATPAPSAPPVSKRRILPWAIALVVLAGLAAVGWWRATRPTDRRMMRLSVDLGSDAVASSLTVSTPALISPDGSRIVYFARTANGTQLATRLVDESKATVLAGTENATYPFFSPDSQWVAFFAENKMKKISVQGGAAVTLCDANGRGGAWVGDGTIVAVLDARHVFRVPEAGGTPQMIPIKYDDKGQLRYRWPQMLPGGKAFLVSVGTPGAYDDGTIAVVWLNSGEMKFVQRGGYYGRYLPSGHLIYVHQGTLFAVPFDLDKMETRGTPLPILDDILANAGPGTAYLDFSQTGTFLYSSGKGVEGNRMVWMDATGKQIPLVAVSGVAVTPRLSPDGKRLALSTNADLSVYDLERSSMTRLTFTNASNSNPLWTPDGKHIAYASSVGGIWWIRADGASKPERIFESSGRAVPGSFSPDGRRLAFYNTEGIKQSIGILPFDTSDPDHPKPGTPELFFETTTAGAGDPALSHDGRWLAWSTNESGAWHVYVRPSILGAPGGGKWQVSTVPGHFPIWSPNGKELFYQTVDGHIMVTEYTDQGGAFAPGKTRRWCDTPVRAVNFTFRSLDLAPDGKRFVISPVPDAGEGKGTLHVTFLINFFDELKRRLP